MALSGCGNNSDSAVAPPTQTGQTPATHTAASGPAISDKLSFDQLTLESPAKPEKDKNGLLFLHFRYADNDGKVYECVLPKAMSEGQYTLSEWSSTFAAYRLPKVVAVKKKGTKDTLGDYPFISPRPAQQQPATAGAAPEQQAPAAAPAPPSHPTAGGPPP